MRVVRLWSRAAKQYLKKTTKVDIYEVSTTPMSGLKAMILKKSESFNRVLNWINAGTCLLLCFDRELRSNPRLLLLLKSYRCAPQLRRTKSIVALHSFAFSFKKTQLERFAKTLHDLTMRFLLNCRVWYSLNFLLLSDCAFAVRRRHRAPINRQLCFGVCCSLAAALSVKRIRQTRLLRWYLVPTVKFE